MQSLSVGTSARNLGMGNTVQEFVSLVILIFFIGKSLVIDTGLARSVVKKIFENSRD